MTDTVAVAAAGAGITFVEAVQIRVTINHTFTGDLAIELTSPLGMKSILFTTRNGFGGNVNLSAMVLLSNAFYGEDPDGTWTIKVIDTLNLDTGTLEAWDIQIWGH